MTSGQVAGPTPVGPVTADSGAGDDPGFRDRLDRLYRDSAPRLLGLLVARCRDFDRAEEALAESFTAAQTTWPDHGWPDNAEAWLFRTAVHVDLDRRKHGVVHTRLESFVADAMYAEDSESRELPPDQRLAMFFLCAHPSISTDTQALLILRYCALVPTADIAAAFLLDVDTTTRRLHRAKSKLESTGVSFDTPDRADWPTRLPPVLAALEVLYDQSWSDIGGGHDTVALARDALHLVVALIDLMPDEPEVLGLASLLCFCESRRSARLDAQGQWVPLDEQDCALWSMDLIRRGADYLHRATRCRRPGPYQWRAMIHAAHARRRELGYTPWPQIVAAYRSLAALGDDPMVQMNLALAEAHAGDLASGWSRFEAIDPAPLRHFAPFLLAEAELLWLRGEHERACAALRHTLVLPGGQAELAYLRRKLDRWQSRST